MPQLFNHKDNQIQREFENVYQGAGGGGGAGDMTAAVYDSNGIAQDLYALTDTGAPTVTPDYVGQKYIDTDTLNAYIATATDGSYNWAFVGRGATSDLSSVAGLTSWYKGENITPTTNGSNITAWNDAGSLLNHCTSVVGTPIYYESVINGQPAAYFNGSSSLYGTTVANIAQPQTHFVVFKGTSWGTGAEQGIVNMHNYSQYLSKKTGSTAIKMYAGTDLEGLSLSDDTAYIATCIYNGASSSLQINDNSASTGNAGTGTNTNAPNIGAANAGAVRFFGYVAEWMVYSGSLSSTDQTIVQTYLNNKYAIY